MDVFWGDRKLRKLIAFAVFGFGFAFILRQALEVIPVLLAEGTVSTGLAGLVIYYMIITAMLGAVAAGLAWAPAVPNHPDPGRNL